MKEMKEKNYILVCLGFAFLVGLLGLLLLKREVSSHTILALINNQQGTINKEKKTKKIIDIDRDGVEDLLVFAKGGKAPRWRAVSLKGFDAPNSNTTSKLSPSYLFELEEALRAQSYEGLGDSQGVPVPGDYNGDGVLDLATYTYGLGDTKNIPGGNWKIYLANHVSKKAASIMQPPLTFPNKPLDVNWGYLRMLPVPADYDGDGATDLAVYDRDNQRWLMSYSKKGQNLGKAEFEQPGFGKIIKFGLGSAFPIPGDVNGDGVSDLVLFQPPEEGKKAKWLIRFLSSYKELPVSGSSLDKTRQNNNSEESKSVGNEKSNISKTKLVLFGKKGDIPWLGDFDCDGKDEPIVFRPSTGEWIIRVKEGDYKRIYWTTNPHGKIFVGDFDGDSCTDLAMYFPDREEKLSILPQKFFREYQVLDYNLTNYSFKLRCCEKDELPFQVLLRELYQIMGFIYL